jgi:hypothetical protein
VCPTIRSVPPGLSVAVGLGVALAAVGPESPEPVTPPLQAASSPVNATAAASALERPAPRADTAT